METLETTFLVIGGGIAGVSCAEAISFLCPTEKLILLTESSLIKTVSNLFQLGKSLVRFDIEETLGVEKMGGHKNVTVLVDRLQYVHSRDNYILTETGTKISYKFLSICTGARPNLISQQHGSDVEKYILGIRDTESVIEFQNRIKSSRKIVIVGNGGIASEIVYELKGIAIDWVIKDDFITSKFVDPGAAQFFKNRLVGGTSVATEVTPKTSIKRMRYQDAGCSKTISSTKGAALGPDWHQKFEMTGSLKEIPDSIKIHYHDEIKSINLSPSGSKYPITVLLQNPSSLPIECDFVVSATGVIPDLNFNIDEPFELGPDQGIFVNWEQRTSHKNIFAAGDICYAGWELAPHWFQMRLWTQARQMGMMAGKSMAAAFNCEEIYQDFCFELFGHVTNLFGYQVVLLGKYNGQGLDGKYEILLRVTQDKEYIKLVMADGRIQGAILIGDTGLEETFENLILNQLDVSDFGEGLLDPDIDIEDYFD